MRIIDADILAYALYDEHIANEYAWPVIEMGIRGKYKLYGLHLYSGDECIVTSAIIVQIV